MPSWPAGLRSGAGQRLPDDCPGGGCRICERSRTDRTDEPSREQLARTSVLFQWDHSQGNQPGCTVPIVMYAIFVNGVLHGWTLYGSPVGYVAQLRPGTTYRLAVLGRDNCTGLISPLSEPLTVTTR